MTTYARRQFRGNLLEDGELPRQVELVADEIVAAEVTETFTDGDSTPSVIVPTTLYKTANTGATTISDFDDGFVGQVITVHIGDANTTIDFTGTSLVGNGGADWNPSSGDSMRCVFSDDGNWYCHVSSLPGGGAAYSFLTHTVTDTDSGYSWAATGSAVADTASDTLTWVSGQDIDIDVDASSDAIRIATALPIPDMTAAETITGLWNFIDVGSGKLTAYDILIGDTTTPDYGIARIGDSILGRTSHTAADGAPTYNLNGAFIFQNPTGPVTGDIEFGFLDSAGLLRFGLPKSAVGNATYSPRSGIFAGPAVADSDVVTVGYWQTQGIFHNLVMDTATSGADVGIQNDLEVEGDIFVDSIKESTTAAGITFGHEVDVTAGITGVLVGDLDNNATGTATLSTTANDYVELFQIVRNNGAHSFVLHTVVSDAGFSVSKTYVVSTQYDELGTGVYRVLMPTSDSGVYTSQDYRLEINVTTTTATVRAVRTSGATAGTLSWELWCADDANAVTVSALSGTGTSAVTDIFHPFRISNILGTDYYEFFHDGSNAHVSSTNTNDFNFTGLTGALDVRDGAGIRFRNSADTDWLELSHDGTDANFTGTNTAGINFAGLTGNVWIRDGAGFRISNSADTDYVDFSHDGTDFNTAFTNTAEWSVSGASPIFDIGGTGVFGWVRTDASPATWYVNLAGQDWRLYDSAGAGHDILLSVNASSTDSLNKVGIGDATPANKLSVIGDVGIYDSAGTDSLVFSHDGVDAIVTGTNTSAFEFRGINNGIRVYDDPGDVDYIQISHNGTNANIDFSGTTDLNFNIGADVWFFDQTYFENTVTVRSGNSVLIYDSTNADAMTLSHNGTDFESTFSGTGDWNITALTGYVWIRDGAGLRISDSADTDYVQFQHDGTNFIATGTQTAYVQFKGLTQGVEIWDGGLLRIYDSDENSYLTASHDGSDFNTALTVTTDWNFTGATRDYNFGAASPITLATGPWTGIADHAVRLQAGTDLDNVEFALSVADGVNSRRARFFLSDEQGTWGLQASASSGVPTFQLYYGNTLRMDVAGSATNFHDVGGEPVRFWDDAGADYLQISHDGTDAILTQVNGVNVVVDASTGYFEVKAAGMRVYDSSDTDYLYFEHNGTDVIMGGINTTNVNLEFLDFDFQDNALLQAEITDYGITHTTPTVSGNAVTVDCTNGNSFLIDMDPATADVTLTLSNPPATGTYGEVTLMIQMGTPAYDITWPVSVTWQNGGGKPTLTTTNDVIDLVHLFTVDAGTNWYGTYSTAAAAGGGSQTPWTSDIDGAGFGLDNIDRLEIQAPGIATDTATFTHDGTDFDTTFANTGDWTIGGQTGDLHMLAGRGIRFANTGDTGSFAMRVNGTGDLAVTNTGSGVLGFELDTMDLTMTGGDLSVEGVVNISGGASQQATFDISGNNLRLRDTGAGALTGFTIEGYQVQFRGGESISMFDSTNTKRVFWIHDGTNLVANSISTNSLRLDDGLTLAITEMAAAPADIATVGQFWVRNDTPNTPMFTDDAGNDRELLTDNVTTTVTWSSGSTATWSSGSTQSYASGVTVEFNDNATLDFGTGNDFTMAFNGTNMVLNSAVGTFDIQLTDLDIDMQDNALRQAVLDDYGVENTSVTPTGTTQTCNYNTSQSYEVDLGSTTGNITITLSNPPASGTYGEMIIKVTQHNTVNRTITWAGGTFEWPGGTAPTMSTGADAIDIYHFSTWNGGTNWFGSVIQAMA